MLLQILCNNPKQSNRPLQSLCNSILLYIQSHGLFVQLAFTFYILLLENKAQIHLNQLTLPREMVQKVAGACEIAAHKQGDKVRSPGVKYRHYRPNCRTALFKADDIGGVLSLYEKEKAEGNVPYIMCSDAAAEKFVGKNLLLLGKNGEEAAFNLYEKLLEGEKKADIIIAVEPDREDGVYLGVMNRLRKSCG